jgi:hypothetical protein
MDEPIACPQCGAPAQITERFWLGSTAGPVEHLKTGCVNNHWLNPPAETLAGTQPDPHPGGRGAHARLSPVPREARRVVGAASPQPRRLPR